MTFRAWAVLLVIVAVALLTTWLDPICAASLTSVITLQCVGGLIVWRALAPRSGAVLTLGVGIAIGTSMAVLSGLMIRTVGLGGWGWALPSVVAISVWISSRFRRGRYLSISTPSFDAPTVVALAIAAVLGLATLLYNLRLYPLVWQGSWTGYHPDMPFFQALGTSLARFGPLNSPFLPDVQVRYHWLVYAWAGQVQEAVGAEPFVVLTRVVPLISLVAASCVVVALARKLSTLVWVPSLAACLLVVGGFLGAVYGGVLTLDSPSQSLGVVWLLALVVAFLELLGDRHRARRSSWGLLAVLGLISFCLVAGKVSAGAPAVAAVVLVAIVAYARREKWRRRSLVAALVVTGAAAAAFWLILSGAAGGGGLTLGSWVDKASSQQGLNPIIGNHGVMIGTAILMVAIVARWAGVGWLVIDPQWRWRPLTILSIGLGASSLVAVALFNSFNEIWFANAVSGPLAVVTAVGAGEAATRLAPQSRKRLWFLLACAAAAVVVFAAVWILWATGPSGGNTFVTTWRWAAPLVGVTAALGLAVIVAAKFGRPFTIGAVVAACVVILVFAATPSRLLGVGTGQVGILQNGLRNEWFSIGRAPSVRDRDSTVVSDWKSTLMDAAAWLRAHASVDDLLATNLTFGPFVPGVTDLPTYVSAIQYQAPYGRPDDAAILLRHENEVWDFIDAPGVGTVAPLCTAGVKWIWVDPTLTKIRDWSEFAEVAFSNQDAIILKLVSSRCATQT